MEIVFELLTSDKDKIITKMPSRQVFCKEIVIDKRGVRLKNFTKKYIMIFRSISNQEIFYKKTQIYMHLPKRFYAYPPRHLKHKQS